MEGSVGCVTSDCKPCSVVGYLELSSRNMVSAVSRLLMSCFAFVTRASSTRLMICGTMTAASRPMMITTTMISIRVKPRARRLLSWNDWLMSDVSGANRGVAPKTGRNDNK